MVEHARDSGCRYGMPCADVPVSTVEVVKRARDGVRSYGMPSVHAVDSTVEVLAPVTRFPR